MMLQIISSIVKNKVHQTGFMPYFQFFEMDIRKNNFVEVIKHPI